MMFLIVIHNTKVIELYEDCCTFDSVVKYTADKYRLSDHEVEILYQDNYLIINEDNNETQFYIGKKEDVSV